MAMQDRDGGHDAQKARARRQSGFGGVGSSHGLSRGLKWGPFWIVIFWAVVMGLLYVAMNHYLKPKPLRVSASGDLVIPRARDGHFYAKGSINGKPVNFLVDTGASLVTVSEQFAREAALPGGTPAVFKTANGDVRGRIVSDVPVVMGPMEVSGVKVAVGFAGHDVDEALLGQSFLSKFDLVLQQEQMTLRTRRVE